MSVKKKSISCVLVKLDYPLIPYNAICINISVPFAQDIGDT